MADRLKRVFGWGALIVGGALPLAAMAQMADPTRPPAGFVDGNVSAVPSGAPVLESVLIPRKGRALAVIGGQTVRVGETYGDARLVRVTEHEAVLEGPGGIERMPLTPGIEKTNVVVKKQASAARSPRKGSKP